jgi:hypothetical protein
MSSVDGRRKLEKFGRVVFSGGGGTWNARNSAYKSSIEFGSYDIPDEQSKAVEKTKNKQKAVRNVI